MPKGIEQMKTPEAPAMEIARQVLVQMKEMDLTEIEKDEVMAIIDEAKEYEANKELSKALNKYQELLKFLKTKKEVLRKTKELEKNLDIQKQYKEQVETLKAVGVLEKLSNGKWGIKDILGHERPIPSCEEIMERMAAKVEMLGMKTEQGFTELLLVPIGMSLSSLAERVGDLLVKKYNEGKLLDSNGDKLTLYAERPVYHENISKSADVKGNIFYYPNKLISKDHGGQTKQELLESWLVNRGSGGVGWEVLLIEDYPDLPPVNSNRDQLEANLTPKQYLAKIKKEKQYANEQFTTPEAQMIYFLEYLYKNNQVIADAKGKGKVWINVGAYYDNYPGNDQVSTCAWLGNDFNLAACPLDDHYDYFRAHTSVII